MVLSLLKNVGWRSTVEEVISTEKQNIRDLHSDHNIAVILGQLYFWI